MITQLIMASDFSKIFMEIIIYFTYETPTYTYTHQYYYTIDPSVVVD